LHEDFDRFDGYGTVNEDGYMGNLIGFHEFLQQEQKFLRALHSKDRNDDRAATLRGLGDELRQTRTHIVMGMSAIAIDGFHDQDFRIFISFRPGLGQATWSGGLHLHASDISSEEKLARICCIAQKKLNHAGAKNVPCVDKPKTKLGAQLPDFVKGDRTEQMHAIFSFLQSV